MAAKEGDNDIIIPSKSSTWNTGTYAAAAFLVGSVGIAVNIFLWSAPMGMATTSMYMVIEEGYQYYQMPGFVAFNIFVCLYVFDFFWPPHLPGQNCMFWEGDRCFGRSILGVAVFNTVLSMFLMARSYPSIPIVLTLLVQPMLIFVFRVLTRPSAFEVNEEQAKNARVSKKVNMLKTMVGQEADILAFYKGCSVAFLLSAVSCVVLFMLTLDGPGIEAEEKLGPVVSGMVWSTPLIVGITNLLFAVFSVLRVGLQKTYTYTDKIKGQLLRDTNEASMVNNLTKQRMSVMNTEMQNDQQLVDDTKKELINQHADHIKSLLMYAKIGAIVLTVLGGVSYGIISFSNLDKEVSDMINGIVGVLFILMVIFLYSSFKRVRHEMGKWILDLPAWKTFMKLKENDWFKAWATCCFLQMVPFVCWMSFLNQRVRRCRGIYDKIPKDDEEDDGIETQDSSGNIQTVQSSYDIKPEAKTYCLTPRVSDNLAKVWEWDAYSVVLKIKLFCVLFMCYYVVQPLFNLIFAYLRYILADVSFSVILFLTFWIGVIAFLLPPVPGMTVYVFGGLIVSDKCPPEMGGFWVGSFVNIFLCWFLKLVACAIQQKGIGEALGKTFYIRSLIGVHSREVRCFEKILNKRGWTLGKVALLCGGPDWPVSVTAGILKLSLVQCEVGTIPIIIFIVPCALTGSLYAAPPGEAPQSLFKIMLFASLMTSGTMAAIIMWAVQKTLEENYYELTKRLPHNVDLHYNDYKNEQIKAKAELPWEKVPGFWKKIFIGQAIVDIWCCTTIYWMAKSLFGKFKVTGDINTVILFGNGGIFTYQGSGILVIWTCTWIMYMIFDKWKASQTASDRKKLIVELKETEQQWKDDWLKEAEEMEKEHEREEAAKGEAVQELQQARGRLSQRMSVNAGDATSSTVPERGSVNNTTGAKEASV